MFSNLRIINISMRKPKQQTKRIAARKKRQAVQTSRPSQRNINLHQELKLPQAGQGINVEANAQQAAL